MLATAARLAPRNAGYALNLVHALELRQALGEALEAGRRYCRVAGQLGAMALRVRAVSYVCFVGSYAYC